MNESTKNDSRWADAQRVESWAGEVRVNLIRLAGIVLFFGNHLINVYFADHDPETIQRYHAAVTAVVVAWSAVVVVLYFTLTQRWVPWWLKYAATFADTMLITTLLVAGGDPGSGIAILYFLVIAAAPLRLSLHLVQVATFLTMGIYLFVQIYAWYIWQLPASDRPPLVFQILFMLTLGAAGLLAGQVVRQINRILRGYPVTVVNEERTDGPQSDM